MSNNQANDRYNPPGTAQPDFEEYSFEDLEQGELFWLNKNPDGMKNVVHRKVGNQGLHLKEQKTVFIQAKTKVYQKV